MSRSLQYLYNMKNCFVISLFIVFIISYSDFTFQLKMKNIGNKINKYSFNQLQKRKARTILEMQLDRKSRSVNETDAEIAYKVASELESKNLTNSANTSAVSKHALLLTNFKRMWPVSQWKKWGFFSDDYLELINDHWLQFPPPSEFTQKALGGFYVLFSTVGCWGNIIVLLMYLR